MIIGTGIDIIEVDRIAQAISRWGDHFVKYVYCAEEIEYASSHKNSTPYYAGRFAAKEAIFKAVSNRPHLGWKDILILNEKNGKPYCKINLPDFHHHVLISISHTHNYAVASAIITA